MTKAVIALILIVSLAIPTAAVQITAPEVPEAGADQMPENTESFHAGLTELLRRSLFHLRPDLEEATQVCIYIVSAVLLFTLLSTFQHTAKPIVPITATVAITGILLRNTNSMIQLATGTTLEICEYGKLLCPVMATSLAAQGGISSSAALYSGTMVFITVLTSLMQKCLIPMLYGYLVFSVANSALGEDVLKKLSDAVKSILSWILKTMMIIFTTYMSITGVVSGSTDAASLKAAKLTISSVVPVVGGILSDASESVLIGVRVMKNAAGIYGILAVLAVFLEPFLKVGVHYMLLKLSAVLCGLFGSKSIAGLVEDFSTALGLLLAITGAGCLLILISTVCFLQGAGI